jgi:hypothetical protein
MKTLKALLHEMHLELRRARYARVFSQADAFQGYRDPDAVLIVLEGRGKATYDERDRLARALVLAHQQGSTNLWSSMLAVAFEPMLERLRARIAGNDVPEDEHPQLVLASFLRAIGEVRFEGVRHAAFVIRQRTARYLFQALRRARSPLTDTNTLSGDPAEVLDALVWHVPDEERRLAMRGRLADVHRIALDVLPDSEDAALLFGTLASVEPLHTLVARTTDGDFESIERTYGRIKQRRTRALRRLRAALAARGTELPS